ncbi:hypothetical protein V491_06551 [Pseudogymnoascus sp. VKM F-3775]|nr:hypothetical protein V491_06551 [Pseudogymnoascus sp. VKM F-3775]
MIRLARVSWHSTATWATPFTETLICVGPPGGDPGEGTNTTAPPPTPTEDPATVVPQPNGDYCEGVSIQEGIALRDLYVLNPFINEQCTNLLLDIAYCVAAVGDINTYISYPSSTSLLYKLTSATCPATTQTLPTVESIIIPRVKLPIAPGTSPDREGYVDYFPIPAIVEPGQVIISDYINSCDFATTAYEVSLDDFLSWNPSLASIDPPPIIEDYCLEYYADHPYPGTISTCTCFTAVDGRDVGLQLCSDIAYDFDITVDQVTSWNPWIGADCDTRVYSSLSMSDSRALCVGVSDTISLLTTTLPTSTVQ